MIAFTDITGLSGSALALGAVALRLPGVARLSLAQRTGLFAAVFAGALIPIDGLPPAGYLRGAIGDLSIASLVLLLGSVRYRLLALWRTGVFNAIPSGVRNERESARRMLLALIVLVALLLYPMALGWGGFDPYRLGYGNVWFLSGLLVVALLAVFRRAALVALVISLAVLAWVAGWYESTNLWDYLLDPLAAVYALGALLRTATRRGRRS